MKANQRKFNIIIIIVMIFTVGFFFIQHFGYLSNTNSDIYVHPKIKISGTYENITINDLPGSPNNWAWAKNQPWCSGSGTLLDPYIIEGHTLKMYLPADGIHIMNSNSSYFIIRNCNITWDTSQTNTISMTGIFLSNTTKGQIINNTIYHLGKGIHLNQSQNVKIVNNTIYDHPQEGILLENCDFIEIFENRVHDNTNGNGIKLESSNLNIVSGNIVYSNKNGIQVRNSRFNDIYENIADNNSDFGIYLWTSENNTVMENSLNNNNDNGIEIIYGQNNTISKNTINNNNIAGIYLAFSNDNRITENTASSSIDGIFLEFDCNNNVIAKNILNNNDVGIEIYYSNFNNVIGNTANDNNYYGMRIEGSNNNTIAGNEINNNTVYGIILESGSDVNYISDNLIYKNSIGIFLDTDCDNNSICKNFFLVNGIHAVDDGTDNNWNSTAIGNYWDNHTSPDVNPLDGIVDSPYTFISGSSGSIDYLPIAEDGAPRITINAPSADSRFGGTAPSFNVEIIDVYLIEMWYSLDGGLHNYTFTINGTIDQTAWDALPEGSVTLIFYARDIVGNEAFEEVSVIKDISAGGLDPGLIAIIVVVSIVAGIVLIGMAYLFLKKRKA